MAGRIATPALESGAGPVKVEAAPERFHAYSREIAERVLWDVANGWTLGEVCEELGIDTSTVRYWAVKNVEGFEAEFRRARELQQHCRVDDLAREGAALWARAKDGVASRDEVEAYKAYMHTIHWEASRTARYWYSTRDEGGGDGTAALPDAGGEITRRLDELARKARDPALRKQTQ